MQNALFDGPNQMCHEPVYADSGELRCSVCGQACQAHYEVRMEGDQFTRNDVCIACRDLAEMRQMLAEFAADMFPQQDEQEYPEEE